MTHDEIMMMPIENVVESESEDGTNSIFISFELNEIRCWIEALLIEENVYLPWKVSYGGELFCPYCNQEEAYCPKLEEHRKTIFERVIQSNSIRLNWLYREYVFH